MTPADWHVVRAIYDAARVQELDRCNVDPRAFRSLEVERVVESPGAVAWIDDAAVGFTVWWLDGYLTHLYVAPHAQGRGIGRMLLAHALARIGSKAWTTAIEGNVPAIRLYQRAGMEVVWSKPRECYGHAYQSLRLALPSSPMHDPEALRFPGALS